LLALEGIKVLDFSTLLPGPMASLILAEAGADVIKVERPKTGDDMRHYPPLDGDDSVCFKLLNRGKKSIALDLKDENALRVLTPLIYDSDIIIEQFRPGVMDHLGLGFEACKEINPAIIYCSITGYGQTGPDAKKAGHDLNYTAETGLLGLSADANGKPIIPPALIADIGGGAYPAIMNILLALRMTEKTGTGQYLDISMSDNLFPFMFWAQAHLQATGENPTSGDELLSGGSPRFQIYETSDKRFLAAAPLEEKFWQRFCQLIQIKDSKRASIEDISIIIKSKSAADWQDLFEGHDVCCSIVATMHEAVNHPHFKARSLFDDEQNLSALPTPLAPSFKRPTSDAPKLGKHDKDLVKPN